MGFGGLGIGETVLILVVVLLIFGPRRLPEIGGAMGKGIREFKRSINEVKHELAQVSEVPAAAPPSRVQAPTREAPGEAVSMNTILPPDRFERDPLRSDPPPADQVPPGQPPA